MTISAAAVRGATGTGEQGVVLEPIVHGEPVHPTDRFGDVFRAADHAPRTTLGSETHGFVTGVEVSTTSHGLRLPAIPLGAGTIGRIDDLSIQVWN